jgi:hypothetical protein
MIEIDLSVNAASFFANETPDQPCEGGEEWLESSWSLLDAWGRCERADWLLWALEQLGLRDARLDRLFACRCVRETPLPDGRKVWDLLTDERSRLAVEVSERFARGEATEPERDAARDAAWAAARPAAEKARTAAWAAATRRQAQILREMYAPFVDALKAKVPS